MALTRITKGVIKPNENYDTHNINSTGIVTATGLDISGNASLGGVLTYEDVTSIDSVGIITANNNIHLEDYIFHKGDLSAYFGFVSDDNILFEYKPSHNVAEGIFTLRYDLKNILVS